MGNRSKRRGEWRVLYYDNSSRYPKLKRWRRKKERDRYINDKLRSRAGRAEL